MLINYFKGYLEGIDITKIPRDYLAFPSVNVLIYKGVAYKRPGTEALGEVSQENNPVIGEYTWKDAQPGAVSVRAVDTKLQAWLEPFKEGEGWVDIFDGIDGDADRVRFATWIDANNTIIHNRLFAVDGSTNLHQWNGAIGVVASVSDSTITLEDTRTAEFLGFDTATDTNTQTIIVNGNEYEYSDLTGQDLTLTTRPSTGDISPGDLVIAKPTTVTDAISSAFNLDHIFNYKNHLTVANLSSGQVLLSHLKTYPISFAIPEADDRTALTATSANLDGNITAMIERKGYLWISTQDDWFKVRKLLQANAFGLYLEVEKDETTARNGALPYAVTNYKGDTMFITQDKTLQMITDSDLVQEDTIKLISDDIALLLERLDLTETRIFSHDRYIYIVSPNDATLLMYDTVDDFWQPPQNIGMSHLSVIGGELCGHSNSTETSFRMFKTRDDLGVEFSAVFSAGYFDEGRDPFKLSQFTRQGISGRATASAQIMWESLFEAKGSKKVLERQIMADGLKTYTSEQASEWATSPWATVPWAGATPTEDADLSRFFLFDGAKSPPYFEFRYVITVSGENSAFELTGFTANDQESPFRIPNDLFVDPSYQLKPTT